MKNKYKNDAQNDVSLGIIALALIFVLSIGIYSVVGAQNTGALNITCYADIGIVAQTSEGGCPLPQTVSVTCPPAAPNMFYEKDSIRCLTAENFEPKKEGGTDLILCARLGKQTYSASLSMSKGCYKDDMATGCPSGAWASGSTCVFLGVGPQAGHGEAGGAQNNQPAADPFSQWQTQLLNLKKSGSDFPIVTCKIDNYEYATSLLQGCVAGGKLAKCPKNYVKGKGKKANTCVLKKSKKKSKTKTKKNRKTSKKSIR